MFRANRGKQSLKVERRQNPRLRLIFPDARMRVARFFHAQNDWACSSIEYLAQRVVHEAYPDLCTAEVRILVKAVEDHLELEFTRFGSIPMAA